jgi:hypothetical protein
MGLSWYVKRLCLESFFIDPAPNSPIAFPPVSIWPRDFRY